MAKKNFKVSHEPDEKERLTWTTLQQYLAEHDWKIVIYTLRRGGDATVDEQVEHGLGRVPTEVDLKAYPSNGTTPFAVWETYPTRRTSRYLYLRHDSNHAGDVVEVKVR